jgi:hypothetical protein
MKPETKDDWRLVLFFIRFLREAPREVLIELRLLIEQIMLEGK